MIPSNKAVSVYKHWEKPEHKEFSQNGHTVFRLYNAFTSAMRPNTSSGEENSNANIFTHFDRTVTLTTAFNAIAEAKKSNKKLDVMKNASEVMAMVKAA